MNRSTIASSAAPVTAAVHSQVNSQPVSQPQQEARFHQAELPASAPGNGGAKAPPHDTPFPYRDYVSARSRLDAAIRRGPFYGLFTAPSGTGKSAIANEIQAGLDRHRYRFIYLSSSLATPTGIVRFLSQALLVSPCRSHLETIQKLTGAMRASPTQIVLWVDDADQVPAEVLAETRVLAECAIDARQLFSVVLCGLPVLRTILDAQTLFPLKRRISVRYSLEGLRRDELQPYLVHRFGAADASRILASTHDELFERALGTPGLILRVASHALEFGGAGVVHDDELRRAFDAVGL